MATPNEMPKKPSKIRQQLLSSLIERKPTSWSRTAWATNRDTDELEEVKVKVTRDSLRYPLAQNMSDSAVDALAKRWLQ